MSYKEFKLAVEYLTVKKGAYPTLTEFIEFTKSVRRCFQ